MVLATRPQPVAEVNGEEISRQQLDARIEQHRQRQTQQLGERASELDLSSETLAPEVLDAIIDRVVLTQRADELSLSVSDRIVMQLITEIPAFQQNGKFSEDTFRVMLSRNGYSLQSFMAEVANDYVLRQLQQGIAESFFMTPQEIKKLVALQEQARSFQYALVEAGDFMSEVETSPEDLQAYYQNNTEQFRTKEKAKFDYVRLLASDYEQDIEVTEADIQLAYQARVDRAMANEQRRASHILISPEISDETGVETDAEGGIEAETASSPDAEPKTAAQLADDIAFEKIKSIHAALDAGEDFAALAKEHSMDPGSATQGGDLGFATRGTMVGAFDEALFALEVGELSEIVKTEFGYHIIKLQEIKTDEVPKLDDIREELIVELKRDKAQAQFEEEVDKLNTLAFESGDLVPLAEQHDLQIKTSDWIERNSPSGFFTNPAILKAAFSTEVIQDGFNADAIMLPGDTEAVVLRLSEHAPAVIQSLETVRDRVQQLVVEEKAKARAEKQGRAAIARLKAGAEFSEITEEYGLVWASHENVKRLASEVPREVTQHVFKMPRPTETAKSFGGVESTSGFAVLELKDVTENASGMSEDEQYDMGLFLSRQLGQLEIQNYLDFHENASDVDINL
jgi:peptidyl-prolyl cis-trans isomerase D